MKIRAKILDTEFNSERRSDERRLLRLDVAVSAGEVGVEALAYDLSTSGLRIETDCELAIGESLLVELAEDMQIEAQVVWNEGTAYGCEFTSPIGRGVLGSAVLRAPFEAPIEEDGFKIEEVEIGSTMDATELARWYSNFEKTGSQRGEKLVGFRHDHDRIIAMILKAT